MRIAALVVALFVLLASAPGVGAVGVDAEQRVPAAGLHSSSAVDSPPQALDAPIAQQSPGQWATGTNITVALRPNGDARWNITLRYSLETANQTAAFREYGESFENGEVQPSLNADFFRRVATQASTVADRDMRIRNVSRTAEVQNGTGVLTLSFVWTEFMGQTDTGQLRLRDAFLLPEGQTWLGTLEPSQRLVIRTPPGYTVSSTSTPVVTRPDSIIITGPQTFTASDPLTIVYQEAEPSTEQPPTQQIPWDVVIGGLVAILIVGALIAGARFLRDQESGAETGEPEPPAETAAGGATEEEAAGSETPPAGEPAEVEEEDLSLLSDEERVERLLERHGGRMKQATIVEETGWSDAKVSQLLSSMAEEGRVDKLRIGRENLISLPDYEE